MQRWSLWTPLAEGGGRCVQGSGDNLQTRTLKAPDLAHIPPLKRRRLSPLARVAFHTLGHCDPRGELALVYSSGLGEIHRTHGLLQQLAAGEPVSPAAFSLSVHNAISGLWSLQQGNRQPLQSVAPVELSPVPALLEAAGLLLEGHAAVAVLFAEEDYPDFYAPWLRGPCGPGALALCLAPASAAGTTRLRLRPCSEQQPADASHNAAVLPRLLQETRRETVHEGSASWTVEHVA